MTSARPGPHARRGIDVSSASFGSEGPPTSLNEPVALAQRGRRQVERADDERTAGRFEEAERLVTQAVADYGAALELDPDNLDVRRLRGIAYEQLRLYDEAFADYEQVAALAPSADASRNLGDVYRARSQFDEALQAYSTALEHDEAYTPALVGRALTHASLADYAAAEADLTRALEYGPEDPTNLRWRGLVRWFSGRYAEAAADYQAVVDLQEARDGAPQAEVVVRLGDALLELDELDRAMHAYLRALELDPTLETAHAGLGFVPRGDVDPEGEVILRLPLE